MPCHALPHCSMIHLAHWSDPGGCRAVAAMWRRRSCTQIARCTSLGGRGEQKLIVAHSSRFQTMEGWTCRLAHASWRGSVHVTPSGMRQVGTSLSAGDTIAVHKTMQNHTCRCTPCLVAWVESLVHGDSSMQCSWSAAQLDGRGSRHKCRPCLDAGSMCQRHASSRSWAPSSCCWRPGRCCPLSPPAPSPSLHVRLHSTTHIAGLAAHSDT